MDQNIPTLRFDKAGPLAYLIIDNKERLNALTRSMWKTLPRLLKEADADPEIKVILMRGSGHEAFSAGADISEFEKNRTGKKVKDYDALNEAAFKALYHVSKPTIALIEGYCFGGGLGLAISCDLRFAEENAVFSIPAARLGLGYPPRMVRALLSVLPPPRAKDLLFTARKLKAHEAHAFGLVNNVFPLSIFNEETLKIAKQISENAPLTIKAAKAAINELTLRPEKPNIKVLEKLVTKCFSSVDYSEGRQAFMDKRKAHFLGR